MKQKYREIQCGAVKCWWNKAGMLLTSGWSGNTKIQKTSSLVILVTFYKGRRDNSLRWITSSFFKALIFFLSFLHPHLLHQLRSPLLPPLPPRLHCLLLCQPPHLPAVHQTSHDGLKKSRRPHFQYDRSLWPCERLKASLHLCFYVAIPEVDRRWHCRQSGSR